MAQLRIALGTIFCACTAAYGATFDVPQGSAESALNEWSAAAGVQIPYNFNVARFYLTDSVRGDMRPGAALAHMLRGSNLTFEWVNNRTVVVVQVIQICQPNSGLPATRLPLPPCRQGPALGEKRLASL